MKFNNQNTFRFMFGFSLCLFLLENFSIIPITFTSSMLYIVTLIITFVLAIIHLIEYKKKGMWLAIAAILYCFVFGGFIMIAMYNIFLNTIPIADSGALLI